MAKDHLKKYFVMKPEVEKIFEDLEAFHDYCRFEMIKFDERDLYRSEAWRRSQGLERGHARRNYRNHVGR